ncbi:hypothetical protein GcM3_023011 [Golovinomyces cichoracearum]|uniref:BRCT domain-containing protein n=1 Tax=Golovinomyces cichoracearum TaxID=62708 RepID=A0A420J6Y1_9PEZI|nr:hypothetical protein GcM3_023011 [Golovinomyces cichoracearum]
MSVNKKEYFSKLQALQDSSDDEAEINELRGLWSLVIPSSSPCQKTKKRMRKVFKTPIMTSRIQKQSPSPKFISSVENDATCTSKKALIQEEIPTYDLVTPLTNKVTLVPQTAQSIVEETPQSLWQEKALQNATPHKPAYDIKSDSKSLKKKYDQNHSELALSPQQKSLKLFSKENIDAKKLSTHHISSQVKLEPISIVNSKNSPENNEGMENRRELVPSIGSVVMKNSTGITSMLRKRKREDSLIKSVPVKDRIFTGQTFLYIPTDDIAPLRRERIAKARSYGAVRTKEWSSTVTHVVVDKRFNYGQVMAYLKPIMDSDTLPSSVILVNDEYPIECVNFRCILDPHQKRYAVSGLEVQHKSTNSKALNVPSKTSDKLNKKSTNPCNREEIKAKAKADRSFKPCHKLIPQSLAQSHRRNIRKAV